MECLVGNSPTNDRRDWVQTREMHHEGIREGCTPSRPVVLTEWSDRDEEIGEVVVMPKCALEFDDLAHLADPLVIRKAPLASDCKVQRISGNLRVVDAVVSANEKGVHCLVPSAVK